MKCREQNRKETNKAYYGILVRTTRFVENWEFMTCSPYFSSKKCTNGSPPLNSFVFFFNFFFVKKKIGLWCPPPNPFFYFFFIYFYFLFFFLSKKKMGLGLPPQTYFLFIFFFFFDSFFLFFAFLSSSTMVVVWKKNWCYFFWFFACLGLLVGVCEGKKRYKPNNTSKILPPPCLETNWNTWKRLMPLPLQRDFREQIKNGFVILVLVLVLVLVCLETSFLSIN